MKALILVLVALIGTVGAHERESGLCSTQTATIAHHDVDDGDEAAVMTVTNHCDGITLDVTIEPTTETFALHCDKLQLVQPPMPLDQAQAEEDEYVYMGHGYMGKELWDSRGYVTLHQPGNRTGICSVWEEGARQSVRFRISVDPNRIDNARPFSFLEPFQVYYDTRYRGEEGPAPTPLLTFPASEAPRVTE